MQAKRRLKLVNRELSAIGGSYQLSNGQLRRRILLLQRRTQSLLDRWPRLPAK